MTDYNDKGMPIRGQHDEKSDPHSQRQHSRQRNDKVMGRRSMPKQGDAHYYTNPFSFALELGFFAGLIWGGFTGCSICCILP